MEKLIVEIITRCDIDQCWKTWTTSEDILIWNTASPDWHTTKSEINLIEGGLFSSRMEAKDGSFGFDFSGKFDVVIKNIQISYTMDDGRKCDIYFDKIENHTRIIQHFEPETENDFELQKSGWQAIMNNFKFFVESK